MKVFKTQKEVEAGIKNDVLEITGDVRFECSFHINASIFIKATDLETGNIDAWDINAWDINAWNIKAWDIKAWDIKAWDIVYYAFCCVYKSIKCFSIVATRTKSHPPICLDGEVEIQKK